VFLADNEVLRRIADAAAVTRGETVLEIGFGHGELTQHLVRRARRVFALEVEGRLVEEGGAAFAAYDTVTLVRANVLDAGWDDFLPPDERVVVAGNIPFYITGPILATLYRNRARILRWTLLLQREVAERICASPGDGRYGALSVRLQLRGKPRLRFVVPAAAFEPVPAVDAAVVSYTYADDELALPRADLFDSFVDFLFGGRRKKLGNRLGGLVAGGAEHRALRDAVATSFDLTARVDCLAPGDFVTLYRIVEPFIQV
jgi:16S rRNA (adenine1518-N6/adenine1519-N6)-dimethyltransferase